MKEKGFWEGVQAAMPTAPIMSALVWLVGLSEPYVTPVEMGLDALFALGAPSSPC